MLFVSRLLSLMLANPVPENLKIYKQIYIRILSFSTHVYLYNDGYCNGIY